MAITVQTAGTTAYSAASGTSVAPSYPASPASGDLLILIVGQKPTTANGGGVTTPSGWSLIGSSLGGGGYGATLGIDTGNTNLFAYAKRADGTETGTLSVTVADNNVCWAKILRLSNATGHWLAQCASSEDSTAGKVSVGLNGLLDTIAAKAGDLFIGAMCIPTDVTTPAQFSAEAFSQTGNTFGTVAETEEQDSATGNDIGGFIFTQPMTAGSSGGTLTLSATAGGTTTNVRGPVGAVRAREVNTTFFLTQYRFRNDDGSETTATWKAALNTSISQAVDTLFRLRVTLLNYGFLTYSPVFKLQAQRNGGGWFDVGDATTVVDFEASANFAENDATTNQLVGGTFIAGTMNEAAGTDTISNILASNLTELEYAIKISGVDVANGDTITFRILDGSNAVELLQTPTLTTSGGSLVSGGVPNAMMMMGSGV